MIVYLITNAINGKRYVGQTTQTLSERRSNHLADSKRNRKCRVQSKLHAAIAKYGIDSFTFEVLASAGSQEELNRLEQEFVARYESDKVGYNLLSGGKQQGRHSAETKAKIAAGSVRAAIEAKSRGPHWNSRPSTPEANAKRSATLRGVKCPARGHAGDANPMKNPDAVQKMLATRAANRAAKLTVTSA